MSEVGAQRSPHERDRLSECVRQVEIARDQLRAARRRGARSTEELPLRAELLVALEAYADAITALGAPVPYQLRAEIDLCRRLT